jgi:catalase
MPSQQVFAAKDGATYTTSNGAPVSEPYAAQRVGPLGPLLLQGAFTPITHITTHSYFSSPDFHHIDLLAHFDRERIPERVVSLIKVLPHIASFHIASLRSMPKVQAHTGISK